MYSEYTPPQEIDPVIMTATLSMRYQDFNSILTWFIALVWQMLLHYMLISSLAKSGFEFLSSAAALNALRPSVKRLSQRLW